VSVPADFTCAVCDRNERQNDMRRCPRCEGAGRGLVAFHRGCRFGGACPSCVAAVPAADGCGHLLLLADGRVLRVTDTRREALGRADALARAFAQDLDAHHEVGRAGSSIKARRDPSSGEVRLAPRSPLEASLRDHRKLLGSLLVVSSLAAAGVLLF